MPGIGSNHLRHHLKGQKLTPTQAILAKCADCTGNYIDKRHDCNIEGCPLHPWMPYNETPRPKIQVKEKYRKRKAELMNKARKKKHV